jgi:docking protein 2
MAAKMKSMKKLITGESFNLPAALDCGESQLNAALSMEAGSRSPLPPSPNHPSSPIDIECNIINHASMRGFLSTDSLNTFAASSLLKNTPHKPPRKALIMNPEKLIIKIDENNILLQSKPPAPPPQRNKLQNYESIAEKFEKEKIKLPLLKINNINVKSPDLPARNTQLMKKNSKDRDYECIENITDAWKTMGIDEIKHTEHVTTPEEELVEFNFSNSNSKRDSNSNNLSDNTQQHNYVTTQKMMSVIEIDSSGNAYDRLEFFGPHSKKIVSSSSSSGYKTIVPINNNPSKSTSSTDDYEFIGDPNEKLLPQQMNTSLETCRLADDSYLGYGVLRKTQQDSSMQSTILAADEDDQLLEHQQHNGLNYAIVSKPKRV